MSLTRRKDQEGTRIADVLSVNFAKIRGFKVMEHQAVKIRTARRADAMKPLLLAVLSVQAWGVVMGVGLIILNVANLTH